MKNAVLNMKELWFVKTYCENCINLSCEQKGCCYLFPETKNSPTPRQIKSLYKSCENKAE